LYISKSIEDYIIHLDASVHDAISKIHKVEGRILLVLDEKSTLKGVVTNGDLLKWLANSESPDLYSPITQAMNSQFIYAAKGEYDKIKAGLTKVLFVPILDDHGRLYAVASRGNTKKIRIEDTIISETSPTYIIAEIGNNHNGDVRLAKKLVDACVKAGANCAKFQMRDLDTLYNLGNVDESAANLGSQYTLDLLKKYQLSDDELFEVFDYCKEKNIQPLCTPWDEKSLMQLEKYGMPAYKVASADFTNHTFLEQLAGTHKPLICSTGMTEESEVIATTEFLKTRGVEFALLHCNSTYPTPYEDINLKYIHHLKSISNVLIGYSGHERGLIASFAAVAMGAKILERHITLDKSMEGNDHKVSLLPDEFKNLVQGVREIELAQGTGTSRKISQGEMMNRVTLAKSVYAKTTISEGDVITQKALGTRSPGNGLQPNFLDKLIGQKAKRDFTKGELFYPSDLEEQTVKPREYSFPLQFGIPVRFHDYTLLQKLSNLDLVEFHLSYRDLELTVEDYIVPNKSLQYVVHAPELFEGDHTLNLCTKDKSYSERSIKEMQRVIDITVAIQQLLPATQKPLIVTNIGGFSSNGFLSASEIEECYTLFLNNVKKLDLKGCEIIPQTMPPFPWHFGGQQYHNLFVKPEETLNFCKKNNLRICFDISHTKLACTHLNFSFSRAMELLAPITAHYHFADSEKTGGEGLQIGEGEIDFVNTLKIVKEKSENASFIPEIWQGHENKGEGFWIALDRLEKYFNE
jgi:sialic acid synthase SpsE